jgi:hypothetical protein
MAVVIKDFEVVAPEGAPQGAPPGGTESQAGGVDRAAMADEIEKLLKTRRERRERLHAS